MVDTELVNMCATTTLAGTDLLYAVRCPAGLKVDRKITRDNLRACLVSNIVNADVDACAGIVYSKLNLSNSIVNADICSTANIAVSKLANGTSGQAVTTDACCNVVWGCVATALTPWTEDIDAANFDLFDVNQLKFDGAGDALASGDWGIRTSSSGMYFNVPANDQFIFSQQGITNISFDNNGISFGSTSDYIRNVGDIRFGASATVATAGTVRMQNNSGVIWRNAGDTDNFGITGNACDQIEIDTDIDAAANSVVCINDLTFNLAGGTPASSVAYISADTVRMYHNIPAGDYYTFRIGGSCEFHIRSCRLDLFGAGIHEIGGCTDASAGDIRMANNVSMNWRNAGNTADFGITGTACDTVSIDTCLDIQGNSILGNCAGQSVLSNTGGWRINVPTNDAFSVYVNCNIEAQISASNFALYGNDILCVGYIGRVGCEAQSGALRLTNTDGIAWRDNCGTGDLILNLDACDNLQFNCAPIGGGSQTPWTSDIDADNFDLFDLNNLRFDGAGCDPGGTVHAIWSDAGGLTYGVPTADNHAFEIGGSNHFSISAGSISAFCKPILNVCYISESGTEASAGTVRLENASAINWRNAGNTADFGITGDACDHIAFSDCVIINYGAGAYFICNTTNHFSKSGSQMRVVNSNQTIQNWTTTRSTINKHLRLCDILTTNSLDFDFRRPEALNDGTVLGRINYISDDGLGADFHYGRIDVEVESDVCGSEDGSLHFYVGEAGTENVEYMSFNNLSSQQIEATRDIILPRTGADAEIIFDRPEVVSDCTTLGTIRFRGQDVATNPTEYARIEGVMISDSAGTECGAIEMWARDDNVERLFFSINSQGASDSTERVVSHRRHRFVSGLESGTSGQSLCMSVSGFEYNVPSGDVHNFEVNNVDQITINACGLQMDNDLDLQCNSILGNCVGQSIVSDAGGWNYHAPTGDTHEFQVNCTTEFVINSTCAITYGNLKIQNTGSGINFASTGADIIVDPSGDLDYGVGANDEHRFDINGAVRLTIATDGPIAPTFTDCTRPCPACVTAGTYIFNSTDGGLNVADGTNWRGPSACGGWANT